MKKNQPHTQESRDRIRQGVLDTRAAGGGARNFGEPWTAAEDAVLGTRPDSAVSAMTGRSLGSIYARRAKLGIPTVTPRGRPVGWCKDKS